MRIGRLSIVYDMAPKGTCWFFNVKGNKHRPIQRADTFFAIQRVYIRYAKIYIYAVIIGRLQVLIADSKSYKCKPS